MNELSMLNRALLTLQVILQSKKLMLKKESFPDNHSNPYSTKGLTSGENGRRPGKKELLSVPNRGSTGGYRRGQSRCERAGRMKSSVTVSRRETTLEKRKKNGSGDSVAAH